MFCFAFIYLSNHNLPIMFNTYIHRHQQHAVYPSISIWKSRVMRYDGDLCDISQPLLYHTHTHAVWWWSLWYITTTVIRHTHPCGMMVISVIYHNHCYMTHTHPCGMMVISVIYHNHCYTTHTHVVYVGWLTFETVGNQPYVSTNKM